MPNFLGSLGQNLFGGIATFVYGKKQKRNQCGPFGTQPPSVFKSQVEWGVGCVTSELLQSGVETNLEGPDQLSDFVI